MIILNEDNFNDNISSMMSQEGIWMFNSNKSCVYLKEHGVIDRDYCEKNDIPIFEFKRHGGTIVTSKGDVGIFISIPSSFADSLGELPKLVVKYLYDKGIDCAYNENDILVEGCYKVAGASAFINETRGLVQFAMHISINVDLEHIKNICTKPMNKIPKGLSEYGVTTEEIKGLIIDFYNQYKKKE